MSSRPRSRRRRALAGAAALTAVAALAPAAAPAAVVPAAEIDRATNVEFGGVDVADDGTGALVYTKGAAGAREIWAALLRGGRWGDPVRIDTAAGEETQPRVAAANGGRVAITYLSDAGQVLRGRVLAAGAGAFGPAAVVRDAEAADVIQYDHVLSMGPDGVAHAAWHEGPAGNAQDVRAARLAGGTWTAVSGGAAGNLDAVAGNGTGGSMNAPDVAIGSDGQGGAVVVWNEDDGATTHPYARRLTGGAAGPVIDLRAATLGGAPFATFGDMLDVAVADDGRAWTVHRAFYTYGAQNRPRAVGRHLTGNTAGPPAVFDGLPANPAQGVERPRVDLSGAGRGLFGADGQLQATLDAGRLEGAVRFAPSEVSAPGAAGDGGGESISPAVGDNGRGAIAWAHDDGAQSVRLREWTGTAFGAALPVGSGTLGPADWASHVEHTGASRAGDVAIGFRRTVTANADERILVAALDQAPSAPVGTTPETPQTSRRPALRWSPATDLWGGVAAYRVEIDGRPAGTVPGTATSFRPTADLAFGEHAWRVVARDARGQETASAARRIVVRDTRRPRLRVSVQGTRRLGRGGRARLRFRLVATDASGLRSLSIAFGDGDRKRWTFGSEAPTRRRTARHAYTETGRFRVTVRTVDRAGNRRTVRRTLRIASPRRRG